MFQQKNNKINLEIAFIFFVVTIAIVLHEPFNTWAQQQGRGKTLYPIWFLIIFSCKENVWLSD